MSGGTPRSIGGFELPERYDRDRLHLTVQGPHTIFAYWEVSNRKRWLCAQYCERDWSTLPKLLRVYDVTLILFDGHNANRLSEFELPHDAGRWYIQDLQPGTVYMADYGFRTDNGQFVPLLRSNSVQTPRENAFPYELPASLTDLESLSFSERNLM